MAALLALLALSGVPGERETETAFAVGRGAGDVVIDGEARDPAWVGECSRTGAFGLREGTPAVPYAEARLVWDERYLYLLLYAADDDVRAGTSPAGDSFRIAFALAGVRYRIDASPLGVLTEASVLPDGTVDDSWKSRAVVAHDVDGTVNDPAHDDEEWIVEMAVPFASLGMQGEAGKRVTLSLARHEVSRDRDSWSTWGPRQVVLAP